VYDDVLDRAVLGCEDCVRQRIDRLHGFEVTCYAVEISGYTPEHEIQSNLVVHLVLL
jgi:hypothetical protein